MIIIETERLTLREFTIGDASFIFELLNTKGWLEYIGDRKIKTIANAEMYISERLMISYNAFGFGMYLVELKDQKLQIGMCGLLKRERLEHVDIGFAFLPGYCGKGYALEAAQGTMKHARDKLGLKQIVAITNVDNTSSQKLLKKLQMNFLKMVKISDDEEELMLFGN